MNGHPRTTKPWTTNPGITQSWYWHATVRQGSIRFNLTEETSPPTLYLLYGLRLQRCKLYSVLVNLLLRSQEKEPKTMTRCTLYNRGSSSVWPWCTCASCSSPIMRYVWYGTVYILYNFRTQDIQNSIVPARFQSGFSYSVLFWGNNRKKG